jgi:alkane 1-monooxygenase
VSIRALKYLLVLSLPVAAGVSFYLDGIWTFTAMIYSFGVIPLIEIAVGTDHTNLKSAEKEILSKDRVYDMLLYAIVPVVIGMMIWFLISINQQDLLWWEIAGRVTAMGMICGVMGINVAHELGHRTNKGEQFLAKVLLLSSLYMHFFVEHNKGHHRNVGTPGDPASARFNEPIYLFWVRTLVMSYLSAWKIQNQERARKSYSFFSPRNEMFWYQLIQVALLGSIFWFVGWFSVLCFVGAALMGALLLETVNYIEHYGLVRKKVSEFRYEDVRPVHSWNSDHIIGRLMLFELTRHSDHHYQSQKKYQLLESMDTAPQLPVGYPGMMVLSLFSPLFFRIMNPRVRAIQASTEN